MAETTVIIMLLILATFPNTNCHIFPPINSSNLKTRKTRYKLTLSWLTLHFRDLGCERGGEVCTIFGNRFLLNTIGTCLGYLNYLVYPNYLRYLKFLTNQHYLIYFNISTISYILIFLNTLFKSKSQLSSILPVCHLCFTSVSPVLANSRRWHMQLCLMFKIFYADLI